MDVIARGAVLAAVAAALAGGCDAASAGSSSSAAPSVSVSAEPLAIDLDVGDFSLVDQKGRPVRRADLAGKVLVVDFIFTTCPTVCPRLTQAMAGVAKRLENEPDVRIVSITVDPENDTPQRLAEYGAKYGADPERWLFLTGEPAHVEQTVLKGFRMAVRRMGGGNIDHAERFLVVDKRVHVRGIFDATPEGTSLLEARARELAASPTP